MFSAWLVSVFALAICAVFFFESFGLKTMAGSDPLGPALYPRAVMAGTALAALVVLFKLARRTDFRAAIGQFGGAFGGASASGGSEETVSVARRVAFAMAISLLYPLAMLKVGFFLATAVFAFILMQMFEQRLWISLVVPVVLAAGLHFFFSDLLNARVVPGQWFDVMRAAGL